jgi:diaminohydroxyphosphoribosylaminopyrimidine deaminase/5-amino-6-(5-phosphoribosylamino)uracil reductase
VFGGPDAPPMAEEILKAKGVEVFRVASKAGRLDLKQVLKALADRGITRLMVEGGPTIAAAFVRADLVDEAAVFHSSNPIGEGIDALEGLPLTALTKSPKLKMAALEAVGADKLELYEGA